MLVDGGLLNPVPVSATLRNLTDCTIAVDVNAGRPSPRLRLWRGRTSDGQRLRVAPVHRVESKQVGDVFDVGEIVDGDGLESRFVDDQLQDCPSDSPQAIVRDPDAHSARRFLAQWMCAS
jgi:predicted acylesterase/phospholipase RssA